VTLDATEVAVSEAHNFDFYRDVLIVLVTAALIVPLFERIRVSPILGFLIAGAALGPSGLGSFANAVPGLHWVTVTGEEGLGALGELGVVFLLFIVGLELSFKRLVTMRRLVFGLGGLQVLVSALLIGPVLLLMGFDGASAIIIALALALSSTAIVVEVLSGQHRLATSAGRSTFSILLFQDLAVVPLLLLVTLLAPAQDSSVVDAAFKAFGQAAIAIALMLTVGAIVLKPLFRLVASSDNTELFVAATLLVAVGSGLATAAAGLSMALGAFIAGLMLAETEFRRAIEATIDPFKGLLLGVFFFVVGMSLDFGRIADDPLRILGAVIGLIALKAAIVVALMRVFQFPWPVCLEAAFLLGPCGEFAFIVATLAVFYSVISPEIGGDVKVIAACSMALIPVLDIIGRRLAGDLLPEDETKQTRLMRVPVPDEHPRAIVIGYGRVGALVSQMLTEHKVAHFVLEFDADVVSRARARGEPVFYGDAKQLGMLDKMGMRYAEAIIVTINTPSEIDNIVVRVRAERPDLVIVARARDAEHARHLYSVGVTDAVPEDIEASLQLSEATLVGLGIPTGPVIASIHEKRDEFRAALQSAMSGERKSRGIRSKASEAQRRKPKMIASNETASAPNAKDPQAVAKTPSK
jgi:K+:H+ antiporter